MFALLVSTITEFMAYLGVTHLGMTKYSYWIKELKECEPPLKIETEEEKKFIFLIKHLSNPATANTQYLKKIVRWLVRKTKSIYQKKQSLQKGFWHWGNILVLLGYLSLAWNLDDGN